MDANDRDPAASSVTDDGISRRAFLGTGVAAGAALLTGGWGSFARASVPPGAAAAPEAIWLEKSIPELQALLSTGTLTSRELTQGYLRRIGALNPLLGAVIETNPQAIAIAAQLDNERRRGFVRGPLHGIPILLKDNIATDDNMQTTAGSLALYNCRPSADAVVTARLRDAGAILLGKANLSEWANFRGFGSINGWSARGGFTRNPYLLSEDPLGSSAGSAVAPAANLCAAAVGTETDGSIVAPSGHNLVVGLKPTVGLLSQEGIIPIAHSQDTAGPMARTVVDAAILLGAMQSPFGEVEGHAVPSDYTQFLRRGSLAGRRIGVDRKYFTWDFGGEPDIVPLAEQALAVMEELGATLVETDSGNPFEYFDDEFTVLLYEFKPDLERYLSTLEHCRMHTLGDLIAFNREHCPAEMRWFGQELFEIAESIRDDVTLQDYLAARERSRTLSRAGIDAALQRDGVDVLVAPSFSWASTPAAVSGYPNLSLPLGITSIGRPAGLWMFGGFLSEPTLLALAYDLEQEIRPRRAPTFVGEPPVPEEADICANLPPEIRQFKGKAHMPHHIGTGKPFRQR
jgi:amidase